MTDVAVDRLLRPRPTISNGRYVIKGKRYTRVSNWIETIDDTYGLDRWKQRRVAMGLAARHDLVARVAACREDDNKTLDDICEAAREFAKSAEGANLGTALHEFAERVDLGETLDIHEPWRSDIDAYTATLNAYGIEIVPEFIERTVVNETLGVAGTFDRIVNAPDLGYCIADLKTGSLMGLKCAMQMACYAYDTELYDPATDTTSPMPFVNKDHGIVVHLPAGTATCTLYLVDLRAGWEAARLCGDVRSWRKRKDLATPMSVWKQLEPTPPTEADMRLRDWLYRRIAAVRDAGHLDELAAAWPAGVPTLRASEAHDAAQLRRIDAAVSAVEVAHVLTPPAMTPLADDDDIEAMVARLQALAPGVLGAVQDRAKAAGLPPVRRMTGSQLGDLGVILAQVEGQALRASA